MTAQQLTAQITSQSQQLLQWFSTLPLKKLQQGLCGLVILWIIYLAIQLVLLLISPNPIDQDIPVGAVIASNGQQAVAVDIAELQASNLFGAAGDNPPIVEQATNDDDIAFNATKTRLQLSLEGVVYTPDKDQAMAVIVYKGKQDQYFIGDKLPVDSTVSLERVLVDHVILNNAGRYESLWLYEDEKKSSVATASPSTPRSASSVVIDKRRDRQATSLAQGYRDRLYKNPSSLAEVLRISPAQKDGQIVGYRVSPGRDRQQFSQLGFKGNDIVTSINGITLDEPSKALEIYKLMRTAKEATFTVDRNGQPVEVLVSLNE
ncbi:MAG: general secretion pathway protein C [Oceanicoccus sp.]